jgi:hypothetical protein
MHATMSCLFRTAVSTGCRDPLPTQPCTLALTVDWSSTTIPNLLCTPWCLPCGCACQGWLGRGDHLVADEGRPVTALQWSGAVLVWATHLHVKVRRRGGAAGRRGKTPR